MDITSLYYFTELAKDLHITRTASRLYISQQTLSNHIQRMEDYYGAKLFYRKPSLHLTCAGEFVLGFAQQMVRENENLKGVLFDVAQQERGLIRFAASQPRASICVPEIMPAFSAKYPNVEMRVTAAVSAQAEPKVLAGDMDLAVVLAGDLDPHLVETPLLQDQIYLCVSDSLLTRCYGDQAQQMKDTAFREGARVSDFKNLPFGMLSNRMGAELWAEFDRSHVTPNVYMTTTYSEMQMPMCAKGLMASFISHMMLVPALEQMGEDMNIFALYQDSKPMRQELVLIRRRDMYLSHYTKYFIELLSNYFDSLGQVNLVRKV